MGKIIEFNDSQHKRLDIAASEMLPMFSRAYVSKMIDQSNILVNSLPAKPGTRLKAGDKVSLEFDPSEVVQIEPIDLPIVYQDEDVIVINKPSGVISHSRGRYWYEPSVASFVRQVTGQEGDRAGIVHRLDRATSGIMICAKNSNSLKILQKQFSDRKVTKVYLGIINGDISPESAVIDMPIERNPKRPQTFRVGSNGKPALTKYQVVMSANNYTLLELTPKTGRTHQLRVHLAKVDKPLVGDELYGGVTANRLMLHASALTLIIPSGVQKTFKAEKPPEFDKLLGNNGNK